MRRLYQLLCDSEQQREELKIAMMIIKNYSREKTNAKAIIKLASKIKEL